MDKLHSKIILALVTLVLLLFRSVVVAGPSVIPFTLTEFNNISVPAKLNDTDDLRLMFHTANHAVNLTKAAVARATTLKMDESTAVTSWGGKSTARVSSDNKLQIGDFVWNNVVITEDLHSGRLTDGKFGPDLFEEKIIEIDFDTSSLKIHDNLPETTGHERLDVDVRHGNLYLSGTMLVNGHHYVQQFMVHSGFGGAVLIDDEFAKEHGFDEKLEVVSESELKDAMGNVLRTKQAVVPSLTFGSHSFKRVPTGLFEGAVGKSTMSVVGGNVLKRFNWLIDAKNARIYLKPNSHFYSEWGSNGRPEAK